MSRPRFHRAQDAVWLHAAWPRWTIKCCDCGLVHTLDFRLCTDRRGRIALLVRPTRVNGPTTCNRNRKARR